KDSHCMCNINRKELPSTTSEIAAPGCSQEFSFTGLKNLIKACKRHNIKFCYFVHSLDKGISFSNITLHHLPKNTMAYLQPCDAGIIYSFKVSNSLVPIHI